MSNSTGQGEEAFALGGAGNIRQVNLTSNMVSIVAATYLSLQRGCQFMHMHNMKIQKMGKKEDRYFNTDFTSLCLFSD